MAFNGSSYKREIETTKLSQYRIIIIQKSSKIFIYIRVHNVSRRLVGIALNMFSMLACHILACKRVY